MAKLVMGIGTSHSPLLSMDGRMWGERGKDDRRNKNLNTMDGRFIPYDELSTLVQDKYADIAVEEHFAKQDRQAQLALDRIAEDLERVRPDVVIIVGDDHYELFSAANMPAISIYHGEEVLTHPNELLDDTPSWRPIVWKGYGMDKIHRYPAHPELAWHLVERLIEKEFDIGSAAKVDDPKKLGFGHAYGFVVERLFRGRSIPIIPVMLNTYFPPNAPTPKRCFDLGVAIREAVEESPLDLRVAIVGSGGLSHFIVEEEFDRKIIAALKSGDAETLRSLPTKSLNSGSSEIRCWITAAGAFNHLQNQWMDYVPARRTPAGTGCGLTFGTWM